MLFRNTQFRVTLATDFRLLTICNNVIVMSRISEPSFVSVYRVYIVSTDISLLWKYEILCTWQMRIFKIEYLCVLFVALSKGCHLDVVRGPSTPHDPESDAGGSLSSWQGHPSR
jgi:hypothetical protein